MCEIKKKKGALTTFHVGEQNKKKHVTLSINIDVSPSLKLQGGLPQKPNTCQKC